MSEQLPQLHLSDAKPMTIDDVLNLFRKLTGREPTAKDIEEARRKWESDDGQSKSESTQGEGTG